MCLISKIFVSFKFYLFKELAITFFSYKGQLAQFPQQDEWHAPSQIPCTLRSVFTAAFIIGYSQPVMNALYTVWYVGGGPSMAYHITISLFLYQHDTSVYVFELFDCTRVAKQRRTPGWLTADTLYTWHRFPRVAPNLTWNLNQDGRIQYDPWEGHSCVGTHWGEHARPWPRSAEREQSESRLSSVGRVEDSRVCSDLRNCRRHSCARTWSHVKISAEH